MNKTFIKELRKKIVRIRIKLKTPIHDQINLNMLNFSTKFSHKKIINVNQKIYARIQLNKPITFCVNKWKKSNQ